MNYRNIAILPISALMLIFLSCTTVKQAQSEAESVSTPEIPVPVLPEMESVSTPEMPVLVIAPSSDEFTDDALYAAELLSSDESIIRSFVPVIHAVFQMDTGKQAYARFVIKARIQNLDGRKMLCLDFFDTFTNTHLASLYQEYQKTSDIAGIMPDLALHISSIYLGPPQAATKAEQDHTSDSAFVWVHAGTYYTGRSMYKNTQPRQKITVDQGFYIGRTEVTQEEWSDVMGTNPSGFVGRTLPVENVTWFDAVDYCNARSRKEGLTPVYTHDKNKVLWNQGADGYRLPTESEWELAARGGAQGGRYQYSGTNDINEAAWYRANSDTKTHPVGSKKANELGLFDMSGNVWEWCWDWYDEERRHAMPTEPPDTAEALHRVLRGGSWSTGESYLSIAYRGHSAAQDRYSSIGFRVIRGAGEKK